MFSNLIKADQIIFSPRKSIAIRIDKNGKILVRAPRFISGAQIERILEEKKKWIERQREKGVKNPPKTFSEGEKFLFFGKEYPLKKAENSEFSFSGSAFLIPPKENDIRGKMENFFRISAEIIIPERVEILAKKCGVFPSKIRISNAKTRRGSCSAKDSLSFSWRLVGAPLEVIDAVVAHELAHIAHKNHSPEFWKKVSKIFPESIKGHLWLKKNGSRL